MIYTTGATSEAGTAYLSGAPEFTPGFSGVHVTRSIVLCVLFCRSLFGRLSVFFWLLCRFMDSDYPFGILDLQILITPLVS